MSRWKPRFVIVVTATVSTPSDRARIGQDLIAVQRRSDLVDREHAIAVAVERDAEVELGRSERPPAGDRDPWRRNRR